MTKMRSALPSPHYGTTATTLLHTPLLLRFIITSLLLHAQPTHSVQCGTSGVVATSCSLCPELDPNSCTSPDCSWMTHTRLCREAFRDDIRTASVHLVYVKPWRVSSPAWWFQRLIVKGTSGATSFSTNGQNFGYGSVQQIAKEPFKGRVVFTIWDGCDDFSWCDEERQKPKTVLCGSNVTCGISDGKQGQMSQFDTDKLPFVNEPYYFVTRAEPMGGGLVQYSGFFYAEVLGGWRFLSKVEISTGGKPWWHGGMMSSVEQVAPENTFDDRSGLFGPSYMSDLTWDHTGNSFFQIPSAYFSFGMTENHEHINAWLDKDGAVGIQTGGDAEQTVSKWTKFDYPDAERPKELLQFASFIPCLNKAHTTKEVETCLDGENSMAS